MMQLGRNITVALMGIFPENFLLHASIGLLHVCVALPRLNKGIACVLGLVLVSSLQRAARCPTMPRG